MRIDLPKDAWSVCIFAPLSEKDKGLFVNYIIRGRAQTMYLHSQSQIIKFVWAIATLTIHGQSNLLSLFQVPDLQQRKRDSHSFQTCSPTQFFLSGTNHIKTTNFLASFLISSIPIVLVISFLWTEASADVWVAFFELVGHPSRWWLSQRTVAT